MENINFILTREQAEDICKYYKKNINEMEDWEICELLDKLIDDCVYAYSYNSYTR